MPRILLSNASFLNRRNVLTDFGISQTVWFAQKLGLKSVELLLSKHHDDEYLEGLMDGVKLVGVHGPWNWCWFRQLGYNSRAARNRLLTLWRNIEGWGATFFQYPWKPAVASARRFHAEYFCVHPDTFMKIDIPWQTLCGIEGLGIENNWTKGWEGVEKARWMAERIGPNTRIVFDTCHIGKVPNDNKDPKAAWTRVKDRVVALHVSDYSFATREEHLVPGYGNLVWLPDLLRWAHEHNPDIPIVPEVRQLGMGREEALRRSIDFIHKHFR